MHLKLSLPITKHPLDQKDINRLCESHANATELSEVAVALLKELNKNEYQSAELCGKLLEFSINYTIYRLTGKHEEAIYETLDDITAILGNGVIMMQPMIDSIDKSIDAATGINDIIRARRIPRNQHNPRPWYRG